MLAQEVMDGRIDLALCPRTPDHRGLTYVDIAHDELAFIVNPMHPWTRVGKVNRASIPSQRFVPI